MSSNIYPALAIRPPRFAEMDFLWLSMWVAFLLVFGLTPHHADFMVWTLVGGGVLVFEHLYSVVYKGEAPQGNLMLAAVMPLFLAITGLALTIVNRLTPVTHDALLMRLDLGIASHVRSWSIIMGAMPPLRLVYDAIPLFMATGLAAFRGTERKRLLLAVIVGGLVCPICFFLFPAVGPVHVGDSLAPRNCMPSMHFTWTLLLLAYSQGTWRWFFGVIAFLTAWATLATGEHYSLDLVAAVLFTWGITVLVNRLEGK